MGEREVIVIEEEGDVNEASTKHVCHAVEENKNERIAENEKEKTDKIEAQQPTVNDNNSKNDDTANKKDEVIEIESVEKEMDVNAETETVDVENVEAVQNEQIENEQEEVKENQSVDVEQKDESIAIEPINVDEVNEIGLNAASAQIIEIE